MQTIYLDQNTLSDLRPRRLEDGSSDDMMALKRLITTSSGDVCVVYSSTHLDEIRKIKRPEYINEHVELLAELNAVYIAPGSDRLVTEPPSKVWADYLENEYENEKSGVTATLNAQDAICRKFAGLSVAGSFNELHRDLVEAMARMLETAKSGLRDAISGEGIDERLVSAANEELERQLMAVSQMPELVVPESCQLGPAPFRDLAALKSLGLNAMKPGLVMPTLDQLFRSNNQSFRWDLYFDDSIHSQIARCYTLMNWAGYSADDFTREKKGKDRFGASTKDMLHARQAAGTHYLISQDRAFLKKAEACYLYLDVKTNVMTVEDALGTVNVAKKE